MISVSRWFYAAVFLFTGFQLGSAQTIFKEDAEASNPLVHWISRPDTMLAEVHELGLTRKRSKSGKSSIVVDVTLNGDGICYFRIPVNVPITPGEPLFASGKIFVEKFPNRARNLVGLGVNYEMRYGANGGKNTSGAAHFDETAHPSTNWLDFESQNLGVELPTLAASTGLPTNAIKVDAIYLGFQGSFKNDRLVVYLDDLAISPESHKKKVAVEYQDFPILKKVFPFGLYCGSGGVHAGDAAGVYEENFPRALWRGIPAWKKHWINTIVGEGGEFYSDSTPQRFGDLALATKIFEKNTLYNIPLVYLSPFYRPDLSWEQCRQTITEQIGQFKDSPSILAWKVIDEPPSTDHALNDYLETKKAFYNVDPNHPVLTGGNQFNMLFEPHRPVAFFDRYPLKDTYSAPHSIAEITRLIDENAPGPVWFIGQAIHRMNGEYTRPSPAEFNLMMNAALANGAKGLVFFANRLRPSWYRAADTGVVDTFESSTALWEEIGTLGRRLAGIGPMLLHTEVLKNPGLQVETGTTKIAFDQTLPSVQVGVLRDAGRKTDILLAYNNDVKNPQAAAVTLNKDFLAGRALFNLETLEEINPPENLALKLEPGQGVFFLLGTAEDFKNTQSAIAAARLAHEKEDLLYRVYFASLAGVVPADLVASCRASTDATSLATVEDQLKKALSDQPAYPAATRKLDGIQATLSELHALFEAKVTSLESLEPRPDPILRRELDPALPNVRAYLDSLRLIGGVYFTLRNLSLKGQYRQIEADLATLQTWTDQLKSAAETNFPKGKSLEAPPINLTTVSALRRKLDQFDLTLKLPYPDPLASGAETGKSLTP